MAGSIVVACKQALIEFLQTRELLNDVQITYGWPGDEEAQRERIFCGRSRAEHTQAALKAGRRFRAEESTFDVVIQVEMVGGSPEEAEERALEIGTEVEECIADEKYLGGVEGLHYAVVSGWLLDSLYNDQGSLAELTYTVQYRARLT
ncbi:MAG TPA: hypothetical protein VEX15_18410 [Nocardioidaceae bacterium]|nr:hypothetical protein [Nocardioidaceae bacterium]